MESELSKTHPPQSREQLTRLSLELLEGLVRSIPKSALELAARAAEIARDPGFRERIATQIAAAAALIEDELDRYERDPNSFLYDEMLAGSAVVLIAAVRNGDEGALLDALEDALEDGRLVESAEVALERAPYISGEQQERMAGGFEQLRQKKWTIACDLLLKAIEGSLWDTAIKLDVIDEDRHLASPQRRRLAKSANSLVGEEGLPGLRPSFGHYLDRGLFNAKGNDLRHARPGRDAREHSLLSVVAIFGWLDHYAETELMAELGTRLGEYADGLDLKKIAAAQ